jgi:hypothetical protein
VPTATVSTAISVSDSQALPYANGQRGQWHLPFLQELRSDAINHIEVASRHGVCGLLAEERGVAVRP